MNVSYKKTLLLALSILTGNTVINALTAQTQNRIDELLKNNPVINQGRQYQTTIPKERGLLFVDEHKNIFANRQNKYPRWNQLRRDISSIVQTNFSTNKILNESMDTLKNAVNTLAATLEMELKLFSTPNSYMKKELEPLIGDIVKSSQNLKVTKQNLDLYLKQVLNKKRALWQQINDIDSDKGWYATSDRRKKDLEAKIQLLIAIIKEEVITELCLKYTVHTLSAITKVINDFNFLPNAPGVSLQ